MASPRSQTITPSLANTRIAFSANHQGHRSHREIYVMNPDGTEQTQLTYNLESSFHPVWSPDGAKIAYLFRDSHPQLYVMDEDGTNPQPLTDGTADNSWPSWSPDGAKIAWRCKHNAQQAAIYLMNADGTNQRRLTDFKAGAREFSWSPDGAKIAFVSIRDGRREIYVMDADGTNPTPLTHTTARTMNPCWSPDGTKIAFVLECDNSREIYVMNADGTNPTRITHTNARNTNPCWSPDGAKIVFSSNRDGNHEIYVMNADGTDQTRLTYGSANKSYPCWSPFLPAMSPNVLQLTDVFASPGGKALVAVRVHANQPLSGLQFMAQPVIEGVPTTVALFTGLINNMASEGMTATYATNPEDVTTIFLFSTNDKPIPPGWWHTALHLVFELSPQTPAGTVVHLKVTDNIFSSPSKEAVSHTLQSGRITIGRPGDLVGGPLGLGDGHIDKADIQTAVDILVGRRPSPRHGTLEFFLTDVNKDGKIDLLDAVEIINMSLGNTLKTRTDSPITQVSVGLGPVKRLESGQPALTVMLESDSFLAALGLVITYTSTQLQAGLPRAVGQAGHMEIACHTIEEPATGPSPLHKLKIVMYGSDGQVIPPGGGTILLIPLSVLREPSPVFPDDTIDLLDLREAVTCQAKRAPLRLMGAAWQKVSAHPFQTTLVMIEPERFSRVTQILYELKSPDHVTIGIHDSQGQELIKLADERQEPGRYGVRWYCQDAHGGPVPAGDYLCRLQTSSDFSEMKMQRIS